MNRLYKIIGGVEVLISMSYHDYEWTVVVGGADGSECGLDKFLRTTDRTEAERYYRRQCKEIGQLGHCVMTSF